MTMVCFFFPFPYHCILKNTSRKPAIFFFLGKIHISESTTYIILNKLTYFSFTSKVRFCHKTSSSWFNLSLKKAPGFLYGDKFI